MDIIAYRRKIGLLLVSIMFFYAIFWEHAIGGAGSFLSINNVQLSPFKDLGLEFKLSKNIFTYSSYYYDIESKMYYLKARYYSPVLTRFISRDTYDLSNRYAYCDGNPISKYDSSGHNALSLVFSAIASVMLTVATTYSAIAANYIPRVYARTAAAGFLGTALILTTLLIDLQEAMKSGTIRQWDFNAESGTIVCLSAAIILSSIGAIAIIKGMPLTVVINSQNAEVELMPNMPITRELDAFCLGDQCSLEECARNPSNRQIFCCRANLRHMVCGDVYNNPNFTKVCPVCKQCGMAELKEEHIRTCGIKLVYSTSSTEAAAPPTIAARSTSATRSMELTATSTEPALSISEKLLNWY